MAKWSKHIGEVSIKVALLGQPGSGKSSILRQIASSQGQAAVRTGSVSEAEVVRTEFIWPEPLTDGPFVRVRVFALSGKPLHQAAEQMVMKDCDAIVFVVDCDPNNISASRDRLIELMANADHVGLPWADTVVVMQYNRAERYPALRPEDLDKWLGIEEGRVARFLTDSTSAANLGVAVDDAVKKVVARLADEVEAKA